MNRGLWVTVSSQEKHQPVLKLQRLWLVGAVFMCTAQCASVNPAMPHDSVM